MSLSKRARLMAVGAAIAAGGVATLVALPGNATAGPIAAHYQSAHHSLFGATQTNLVSNVPGMAPLTDAALQNPWGIAFSPTSPVWIANADTSIATLYTVAPGATTAGAVPTVRVPVPGTTPQVPGLPAGQVFNSGKGFVQSNAAGKSGPATFVFSTLNGNIAAWAAGVDSPTGPAQIRASVPGAAFTGMAIGTSKHNGDELFAADFTHNKIAVFDSKFQPVTLPSWAFQDKHVPAGLMPFNAQNINGDIFVTYAGVDPNTHEELKTVGAGAVDEFDTEGHLIARIATRGLLDAPWGLAVAPKGWGALTGSLLIGNFGDGKINVLPPVGRHHFAPFAIGQLKDNKTGKTIAIPGLWSLQPGTSALAGTDSILFTAGIDDEKDGLFGVLRR